MMYDYSQTQTLNGFYVEDSAVSGGNVPDGYKFGAVINPISKWDVDGDGNHTDVMRFTESWRSTKVSGLALNGALASEANDEKRKAALQFVDYLYSSDGQIVSTYGPMADAQGNGGFWYNEKATADEIAANKYFSFKGEKYSGSDYKGRTTPTITSKVYDSFKGKEVNGWKVTSNTNVTKGKAQLHQLCALSYRFDPSRRRKGPVLRKPAYLFNGAERRKQSRYGACRGRS